MKFQNNRQLEEKKLDQEVTDEWEKKLQQLTAKYEDDLRSKKKDKTLERVMITSPWNICSSLFLFVGINHSFYERKS